MNSSVVQLPQRENKLAHFAWALVWYTVLVILWGAWVRISHSGDGCGDNWPLCHGAAIPVDAGSKTWIEISHRYSTALYGIFAVGLLVATWRRFSAKHAARIWSVTALVFTVTEALIGRQLVKLGLVDQSTDLLRLLVMPLHLVNTSALLVSVVMLAESLSFATSSRRALQPSTRWMIWAFAAGVLVLLCSGAVAALGSHLAPSSSLSSGLAKDLSADSHLAVRLRLLHPFLALSFALLGPWALVRWSVAAPGAQAKAACRRLLAVFCAAIVVGVATLLLLAPVWLKIAHLLLANVLIIFGTVAFFRSTRDIPDRAFAEEVGDNR